MGGIGDFRKMSDEEILKEIERLLGLQQLHYDIPAVSFYQLELSRRTIKQLRESSGRLELLTKVLVGATVVLLLVALPPAVEVVIHLCSR
jgi:hypothetical protein